MLLKIWKDVSRQELMEFRHSSEELPQQWKEFISVPIYWNGDKIDCEDVMLCYEMLSSVLLSRIMSYEEIINVESLVWLSK